jgi:hypothetical protein
VSDTGSSHWASSFCRKHFQVLSSFMSYHGVCN